MQEDDKYCYYYDAEGNLIFKEYKSNSNLSALDKTEAAKAKGITLQRTSTGWEYEWAGNGMLQKVINPGGREIVFYYDALGRRTAKISEKNVTRFVWDGNVPLHEWSYEGQYPPIKTVDEEGIKEEKEPTENIVTWVYEEGSFVPCGKFIDNRHYSIIADYLGTPTHCYDETGNPVWERELDIYGTVRKEIGEKGFVPQLYQGQYVDEETGLAYNRFRYYDSDAGNYISQDPIGLDGGVQIYTYVHDTNFWMDVFGLARLPKSNGWWDGTRGSSNWYSNNQSVQSVTKGKGVPFKDGYPDFSKWSASDFKIDNLTGTKKDFDLVHERIMTDFDLSSKAEAKRFLREAGLTAHHHQDMRTIQLIPSKLHNNVPHEGGASKLRNAHH